MNILKCIGIILSVWFFSFPLYGQKYSNEFLSIGVGARAQGMGSAQVAGTDDVAAAYWNPAGLMNIQEKLQIGIMHSEWFAGIGKYDYVGFALPFQDRKRVMAFSFIRFGIDNIPNTLSLYRDDGSIDYSNISPFSAADYALLFSYAQHIIPKLSIGGNVKIVHHKVGPFASSWGFGLDAGLQYKNKGLRLGLLAKDITTTFNAWNFRFTDDEIQTLQLTGNEVPVSTVEITKPQFILGAAYRKDFPINTKKVENQQKDKIRTIGVLAEVDFAFTTDGRRNVLISANPISIDPSLGVEFNYNKLVFIRGGINKFQKKTDLLGKEYLTLQPNAGIGIKIFKIRLDYALTNVGNQSDNLYSHVISMTLDLNFNYLSNALKNAE